jgi:transcriptional regulator with XRE-family HTH domain
MSKRQGAHHDSTRNEAVVDAPITPMTIGKRLKREGCNRQGMEGPTPPNPNHLIRVGQLLKGLREKRGFSQIELAKLCGVTSAHISQIEKGRRLPADALCFQLAQHLDVNPVELSWRVRAEKSPEAVRLLYDQGQFPISPEAPSPSDPRIEALVRTLQDLQTTIPEARYERLLDTIFGVLSPYGETLEDRVSQRE